MARRSGFFVCFFGEAVTMFQVGVAQGLCLDGETEIENRTTFTYMWEVIHCVSLRRSPVRHRARFFSD